MLIVLQVLQILICCVCRQFVDISDDARFADVLGIDKFKIDS